MADSTDNFYQLTTIGTTIGAIKGNNDAYCLSIDKIVCNVKLSIICADSTFICIDCKNNKTRFH